MTTPEGPAWLRAAVLLGVPSVIALLLVYWVTFIVDIRLLAIQVKVDLAAVTALTAHESMTRAERSMGTFADETRAFNAHQLALLAQICRSLAKTSAEFEGCR